MTDNEELKRVYNLFTDCWRLFKKYSDVKSGSDNEYWQGLIDEGGELSGKYDNDKFAISLILAIFDEFERKEKEMNRCKQTHN